MQLSEQIIKAMVELKEKGDLIANKGKYQDAITLYRQAYELLPIPRDEWEATTWILGIIGDAYFLDRRYSEAFETLNEALRAPGALGNPFIHLRLGQCALEIHDYERAKDELMRAYMLVGQDIFLQDNPKYLEFLAQYAVVDTSKLKRRHRPR